MTQASCSSKSQLMFRSTQRKQVMLGASAPSWEPHRLALPSPEEPAGVSAASFSPPPAFPIPCLYWKMSSSQVLALLSRLVLDPTTSSSSSSGIGLALFPGAGAGELSGAEKNTHFSHLERGCVPPFVSLTAIGSSLLLFCLGDSPPAGKAGSLSKEGAASLPLHGHC
jgi:hypothetical protein